MSDTIKAMNVRLPKDVINLLDMLVKKGLYSTRAEAIRDFARDFVNINTPNSREQHDSAGGTQVKA